MIYFRESINLNDIVKIVQEILKEDGQKKRRYVYEKKNHHCGAGHRCHFCCSCGCLCFGTDTGIDMIKPRRYDHERKQKTAKRGT